MLNKILFKGAIIKYINSINFVIYRQNNNTTNFETFV